MPNNQQSTDLGTLMASIQTVLTFAGAAVPQAIQAQDIVEWYGEEKPRYNGTSGIYFRPVSDRPKQNWGAARFGHLYYLILEVACCTRLITDVPNQNTFWSRDAGRGHFILRKVVNDYLQDNMLFASYDPITQDPTGNVLTVACVQRVDPEGWVKKPIKGDSGWGESRILYSIPLTDLLTQPLPSAPG